MQQFIDFFNQNIYGFLATIDGNRPRVRPWGFMFEDGGKIWFLTTNQKRVFKQLQENPYVEFCSCSPEFVCGRIGGKIEFCNDLEIKTRILDERPALKDIYETPDNPLLEAFYLEHGSASLYSSKLDIDEFIEF
ncbi:MAG: pyridoxamine 5'-phosphate oxidase family protein [Candidatus Gastranaerophilaceae bacterium]